MAELNNQAGDQKGGRSFSKTLSPRVDMTPMVDLMFLLITFFMLTTTLRKQYAMELSMPADAVETPIRIADNRTMNLLLGKDSKVQWYMGNSDTPLTTPVSTGLSASELRKILLKAKAEVFNATGKGLIVLVKPGATSKYKNLVDVLDELKIAGLDTYSVIDVTATDRKRMKAQDLY